ncbi:kelch-like protein 40b [Oppia nitens]|uniref:kelch-like protein 40b n=1 Tax=Oppia nitens TaxID=1686743 RepID=UPI0023DA84AE|nr:kelch-like protein 40b [Oppia nitens]
MLAITKLIIIFSFTAITVCNGLQSDPFIHHVKRQVNSWTQLQNDGPVVQPIMRQQMVPPCDPHSMGSVFKRSALTPQTSNAFPGLEKYYLSEDQSDVTFVGINGTKLPAHKFVLAAKSSTFDQFFKETPNKNQHNLQDMGYEDNVFKVLLHYLYTEQLKLDESENRYELARDVYKIARKFNVDGLMKLVELMFGQTITMDNYLEVLKYAQHNQMHDLMRHWTGFVFQHSPQIISDEAFMNETVDTAKQVLMALNAQPNYILSKIKKILADNPTLRVQQLQSIVPVDRCNIDDLLTLNEIQMYDQTFLLNESVKRFKILRDIECHRIPFPRFHMNDPMAHKQNMESMMYKPNMVSNGQPNQPNTLNTQTVEEN